MGWHITARLKALETHSLSDLTLFPPPLSWHPGCWRWQCGSRPSSSREMLCIRCSRFTVNTSPLRCGIICPSGSKASCGELSLVSDEPLHACVCVCRVCVKRSYPLFFNFLKNLKDLRMNLHPSSHSLHIIYLCKHVFLGMQSTWRIHKRSSRLSVC